VFFNASFELKSDGEEKLAKMSRGIYYVHGE